ncbi:MAG: hypothetical protein HPY50_08265 [Firmicutes bacterium]|nr:hypothetical protein [Bacillota bacterium]
MIPRKIETWILLSIIYCDMDNGTDLSSIINTGDYINHAILTDVELDEGLKQLIDGGYVYKRGNKYFPAGSVLSYYRSRTTSKSGVRYSWKVIEEYLDLKR